MRTAIILLGNIRSWMECQESFKKVFDPINADIFVSTYDVQWGHHPHIQGVIGDNSDVMLTDKEIVDMFKGFNLRLLDINNFIELSNRNWNYHPKYSHLGANCFIPIYNLNVVIDEVIKYEDRCEFKYDLIIKTRPDVFYADPSPLTFDAVKGRVIVDSGNVFPSDVILATDRDSMVNIADFMLGEFYTPIYPDSDINPPHNFYLNAMKHLGMTVETRRIMDYIIRKTGFKHYY